MIIIKELLFAPSLVFFLVCAVSASMASDRAALRAIYASWNSPDALNWKSPNPCDGTWNQVFCTKGATQSTVTKIDTSGLNINSLKGPLDPAIGNLTDLTTLQLAQTGSFGQLPNSLSLLTNLRILRLDGNYITGPIPQSFSTLTLLTYLSLSDNLGGTIPAQLSTLTSLNSLGLHYCRLTGSIPPQLSTLVKMNTIFLGQNQLTGGVPSSLVSICKAAATFEVAYNDLICGPFDFHACPRIYADHTQLGRPCPSPPSEWNLFSLITHCNVFVCIFA